MIIVKVFYADGDETITRFNGTPEQAEQYYTGKTFNTGCVSDRMQKCAGIEILESVVTC